MRCNVPIILFKSAGSTLAGESMSKQPMAEAIAMVGNSLRMSTFASVRPHSAWSRFWRHLAKTERVGGGLQEVQPVQL